MELINKFHILLVFLKDTHSFLKELKLELKKLVKLFINNGYKISIARF